MFKSFDVNNKQALQIALHTLFLDAIFVALLIMTTSKFYLRCLPWKDFY